MEGEALEPRKQLLQKPAGGALQGGSPDRPGSGTAPPGGLSRVFPLVWHGKKLSIGNR